RRSPSGIGQCASIQSGTIHRVGKSTTYSSAATDDLQPVPSRQATHLTTPAALGLTTSLGTDLPTVLFQPGRGEPDLISETDHHRPDRRRGIRGLHPHRPAHPHRNGAPPPRLLSPSNRLRSLPHLLPDGQLPRLRPRQRKPRRLTLVPLGRQRPETQPLAGRRERVLIRPGPRPVTCAPSSHDGPPRALRPRGQAERCARPQRVAIWGDLIPSHLRDD